MASSSPRTSSTSSPRALSMSTGTIQTGFAVDGG
jgi:hypothetical protein